MNTKECPFCLSQVPAEAKKCKHCAEWLTDKPRVGNRDDNNHTEGKVRCLSCSKMMVPRIITGPPSVHGGSGSWTPVPKKSICPYCAATHTVFPKGEDELKAIKAVKYFGFIVVGIIVALVLYALPYWKEASELGSRL